LGAIQDANIMAIRCLTLVVCLSGGALLVGCDKTPELAAPEFTAEQAKAAMIDLLSSTEFDYMHGFPLDKFASEPVKIHPDGRASWANFYFDLKARKYSYHIERGEPNTKGHFAAEYEGSFEFKQGKWVGSKPRVKSIT
jgi:hypothetical protein